MVSWRFWCLRERRFLFKKRPGHLGLQSHLLFTVVSVSLFELNHASGLTAQRPSAFCFVPLFDFDCRALDFLLYIYLSRERKCIN